MRHTGRASPIGLAFGVAVVFALMAPGQADAQSVHFSGWTYGCFTDDAACMGAQPGDGSYQSDTMLPGLQYDNSNFAVDAALLPDGSYFTGVGSTPAGAGIQETNNFGAFYLDNTETTAYHGKEFSLWISFVDPTSNTSVFLASLTGVVNQDVNGPSVNFDNSPQYWYNGDWQYSVSVNDLALVKGEGVAVTGEVTAVVPEPISMGLMATGLFGLAGVARRRRGKDVEYV